MMSHREALGSETENKNPMDREKGSRTPGRKRGTKDEAKCKPMWKELHKRGMSKDDLNHKQKDHLLLNRVPAALQLQALEVSPQPMSSTIPIIAQN